VAERLNAPVLKTGVG